MTSGRAWPVSLIKHVAVVHSKTMPSAARAPVSSAATRICAAGEVPLEIGRTRAPQQSLTRKRRRPEIALVAMKSTPMRAGSAGAASPRRRWRFRSARVRRNRTDHMKNSMRATPGRRSPPTRLDPGAAPRDGTGSRPRNTMPSAAERDEQRRVERGSEALQSTTRMKISQTWFASQTGRSPSRQLTRSGPCSPRSGEQAPEVGTSEDGVHRRAEDDRDRVGAAHCGAPARASERPAAPGRTARRHSSSASRQPRDIARSSRASRPAPRRGRCRRRR